MHSSPDIQPPQIEGMFWQPDLATTAPKGNWDLLVNLKCIQSRR